MVTLVSPGVAVSVTDESFYNTSGQGTIPLIVFATAANKASPSAGGGIAPYTAPSQAGQLYLATGQRDLIQNFGNPIFYSSQGTPLHGYELNEYGLWAAYSYLGIADRCYVLRANIDLAQLLPSTTPPTSPPLAGTYWFDLGNTQWGVLRANGQATPATAWSPVTVLVALTANVDSNNVPLTSFGSNGNVCVVATTKSNYLYENIGGTWYQIGSSSWRSHHPTIVTGSATTGTLVANNTLVINGTTVTISTTTFSGLVSAITSAGITGISAALSTAGALVLTNSTGGAITLSNGTGTPLVTLGLGATFTATGTGTNLAVSGVTGTIRVGDVISGTGVPTGATIVSQASGTVGGAGVYVTSVATTAAAATILTAPTFQGVSLVQNSGASYPSGNVAGSIWVKGNPANNGANWAVKYYNSSISAFTTLSAPFYPFTSSDSDGNPTKDAAAIAAIINPAVGSVYIGYDTATFDQQIRRWSGTQWQSLVYEAEYAAPTTAAAAGTYWFNNTLSADIMVDNGENWVGYTHMFPATDPNGVQLASSPPSTQSNGTTALAQGDLWIDTSDTENYPQIYRWNLSTLSWGLIDNTDHTTPNGIVFGDARQDSGPAFSGITNANSYTYSSTLPSDLAMSDYVEPDAPNPLLFPAGTLLFNTRYSANNVKVWTPGYFRAGGFSPSTDYTLNAYSVGGTAFTFPALTSGDRWVTASGNQVNGSPNMGRKAQRILVVNALGSAIASNGEIRSEIVFFNLMAAPGYPEMMPDLVSLNADMKQVAFGVGDTPARLASDGRSITNWATNAANAAVTGEDGLTISDNYTGVYYPWGLSTNLDGSEIMIPPSAIALATIAYNDQVSYPWYAPAGFNRGLVTNASSVGYLDATSGNYTTTILNQGQRDTMYLNKINPIAYIPNRGLVVYGQKTLDPNNSALDRINVARLMNFISYNLDIILKPFLFEPNTSGTRAAAKATVERFFSQLVGTNGLYDFAVVCDGTNNPPNTIDQNELWVDCAVQPVKTIEFIYVPVRILTTTSA